MRARRIFVAAVIAGQLLVLTGMLAWQEYRWRTWTPVQLRVAPVDPVSLFRGRYVCLSYDFSTEGVAAVGPKHWDRGEVVYVRLQPDPSGKYWKAAEVSRELEKRPDSVWLRAEVMGARTVGFSPVQPVRLVQVRVPALESYYLSERQAPRIERLSRRRYEMAVEIVVGRTGDAALKQLYIEGVPAEEFEPGE